MTGRGASVGPVAFTVISLLAGFAVLLALRGVGNQYGYFLGYVILQSVVLATAWNVLGGYAGYVNFGAAAFFAAGAYTTVALHKAADLDLPACILAGACVSGLLGLGTGYLALRLRGVYFSIATLSLAVLLQTLVVNWRYVGGSSGAYLVRPRDVAPFASYGEYLIGVMLVIAIAAVGIARAIEKSRLGLGLTAIRDDERAAAACGVPTLRLKLVATTISGALLGMAGAPFPFYTSFLNPDSAFALAISVNAMAMPLIGGTRSWIGPVVGALLLSTIQQAATVTISSSANLLIVGLVLVGFVAAAPNGILGLLARRRRAS